MKAIATKTYASLTNTEKQRINKMCADMVQEKVWKEEAELQAIYMMLCCKNLHESFDFDAEKCNIFLGNWFRLYEWNSRLKTKEEQSSALDAEMEKIFGKDGYPKQFIEYLKSRG